MLALAISITAKAFENVLDKGGHPYVMHCIRVMMDTKGDEEIKCAAVMHDLIEDTDYTLEDLRKLKFSEKTCRLVDLLTRRVGEPYEDFIKRISIDPDASEIKRKDIKDNLDVTRLKGFRKKDFERVEKYQRAFAYLSN